MVNAQKYLNEIYPTKEERERVTELMIEKENLEGHLDLSDFVNLEVCNCSGNSLTSIDVSNCLKLKKFVGIENTFNQSLDIFSACEELKLLYVGGGTGCKNVFYGSLKVLENCKNLEGICLSSQNQIRDLEFLNAKNISFFIPNSDEDFGEKIKYLGNVRNWQLSNLGLVISKKYPDTNEKAIAELEEMSDEIKEKIIQNLKLLKNKFQLELELRDLKESEEFYLRKAAEKSNTIEILRENLGEEIEFDFNNIESKILEAEEEIKKLKEEIAWGTSIIDGEEVEVEKEEEKVKVQQLKIKLNNLNKIKEEFSKLKNELEIEREHAQNMDNFYRQNPPREDIRLANILQKITDDYLTINCENEQRKLRIRRIRK